MRPYSIALAANVALSLDLGGTLFYLESAPYPVTVEFFGANGVKRDEELRLGLAGMTSEPEGGFSALRLTSANAQTVRFYVGRGRVSVNRVAGEVSIVDGGRARTNASVAFSGFVFQLNVAAEYAHAQLWNPAGSGKRIVLNWAQISQTAQAGIPLYVSNAAFATLYGNPRCKKLGAANSVMELRTKSNAARDTGAGNPIIFNTLLPAFGAVLYEPKEPVLIPPNSGVQWAATVVNMEIDANFDFYEEDDV